MARTTYMVLSERKDDRTEENWRVQVKGSDDVLGRFERQEKAIEKAREVAIREHKEGDDTQVLVQASTGEWRTEWTYGRDPHPPQG